MRRLATCAAIVLLASALASAQNPDVIVGDLTGPSSWGVIGGTAAYSVGTTSCNQGTTPLDWFANPDPRHPVIAQNMYRHKDGRFEQIGQSWLKHGFFALSQDFCGSCIGGDGDHLGVNCSDPYSSALNGDQTRLGPRSDVNASTGEPVERSELVRGYEYTRGQYVVFVLRDGQPTALNVRTGLTDLDYSEVVSGLTPDDSVMVLPSASLVQSQQAFQERIQRVTGGGLPGVSRR